MNAWHSVRVDRLNRDGNMIIDSQGAISGQSQGGLNELNLNQPFYVGGVKVRVKKNSDVTKSLAKTRKKALLT